MILKLAPPPSDQSSENIIVNQNFSGFNIQGWIEIIDADFPVEIDGLELSPNLSSVYVYNWNVEVYE